MPTDSQVLPGTEKPQTKAGLANRKNPAKIGSYSQGHSPDIHRSLPNSLEAEQGVLGSMLIAPMDVIGECVERISEKAFYLPAHATIYALLVEFWTNQQPSDLILITQALRDRNLLDTVGGAALITHLFTFTPTAANASYYIDIVREKYVLRQIIGTCTECARRAYEEQGEVPTLLDDVEREILAIGQDRFKDSIPDMKAQVMEAIETIEKLYERKGALTGLPSGFANLDKMTSGLHPAEMIVIAARPSMGKCLAFDAEILLTDGTVATMEELYRRRRADLLTLGDDLRLSSTNASDFIDDGIKPVFKVTTRLGRCVESTLAHPFLTLGGWQPLADLRPGARIAVPRRLEVFGNGHLSEAKVKILSYLLGDGGLTNSNPRFTNGNPILLADFEQAVASLGGLAVRKEDSNGTRTTTISVRADINTCVAARNAFSVRLIAALKTAGIPDRRLALALGVAPSCFPAWKQGLSVPRPAIFTRLCELLSVTADELAPGGYGSMAKNGRNLLTCLLDDCGLMGCGAHTKFVPKLIFPLGKAELALFLNRLFATDGWAGIFATGQAQIGYASVSERLIRKVQHLLLRFGIICSLRKRSVAYREGKNVVWQLEITDAQALRTFIAEIGIFSKEAAVARVAKSIGGLSRYHTNRDLIPVEIWPQLAEAKGSRSWSSLGGVAGLAGHTNLHVGQRALSRGRLLAVATALEDTPLKQIAQSDVYWDEIVSIEYGGEKQVYDLTIPVTHNFIANDLCVHNTAFAMNIAEHVALVAKHPVAIFSLEMSSQQLVQRMLCSRARVNLQKVRDGFLSERDFPSLTQAASKLAESQIFIDDTAGLSILELRAKARRFKQMHDIQLIVIDYLQLLRSTSRRAQDNRQLEIAEISSGVKALAKELKIPIIVLAQLNRQPEARTGGKPRLSDLRESGCLAGDTLITLADTGERVTVRQLSERPRQTPIQVQAVNPDYTVSSHTMTRVFSSGRKRVYQLKTSSGRTIKASANHPFLKLAGWTPLDELTAGDHIALPRHVRSERPANTLSDDEIILLAHLIGDGCILPEQPYHYTSADERNLEIVRVAAERLFGIQGRLVRQENWFHLYLTSPTPLTHGKSHPITEWFEKLGLQRCRSYEKRLPTALFQCGEEKIALFLKHLWATDGNISWKCLAGRQDVGAIYYASSSRELAGQAQHLLLRLGIHSSLRDVPSAKGYRMMYHVQIEGSAPQLEFLTKVGCAGARGDSIPALELIQANPNNDAVPKEVWPLLVQPAKEQLGLNWRDVCARLQMSYGGFTLFKSGVSRARMMRLHEALLCVRLLQLACSDVFWDMIVSIEALGEEEVYDATVEGAHNFVADDIIVHNSIEQDADLVGLLVRSEYYAEDEEAREEVRGEAELIIAKQRNGPVGEVKLTFLKEFTRFEDRADTPATV